MATQVSTVGTDATIAISSANSTTWSFSTKDCPITIGMQSEQVWNAIALPVSDADQFQCSISFADGVWSLHHGQRRTECPKGLRSDKQIPCNFCMGCCVNIRVANPHYLWRTPSLPTLLNGIQVFPEGLALHSGDSISFGGTILKVKLLQNN